MGAMMHASRCAAELPSPGRRRRQSFRIFATAVVLGIQGTSLAAQDAAPAASPVQNPFAAQAGQLGASKCVGLFAGLGHLATQGAGYGVQVEANKTAPDEHALQGVAGMTYALPEIQGPAASVVLAAPTPQGCQGNVVRVTPFQRPCPDVVGLLPTGAVAVGDLAGVPLYNVSQSGDRILLIANGDASCVVVSVNQGESTG